MPSVVAIKDLDEFRKAIGSEGGSSDEVAIIDYWATWCGPCRMISPIFEKMAGQDTSGKVKYYSVDVDDVADVAAQCKISAMPTFIAFQNGKEIGSFKGADPGKLADLVQKCTGAK